MLRAKSKNRPQMTMGFDRGVTLLLDKITADVSSQLDAQARLGVKITRQKEVPRTGPANRGVWFQIRNVTAVFADLKRSTELNANAGAQQAAVAYTYFIRAMTIILDRFEADYIDVQGDGIFGLFSGPNSHFNAAACAITMRTQVEREVDARFRKATSGKRKLRVGIGMDRGTLLVRRLGLRGSKMNEVWAGTPVNMAAKLSSVAGPNQVVMSERLFSEYEKGSKLRQRALMWSCGCKGRARGRGLDLPISDAEFLWQRASAPGNLGLDFNHLHRLRKPWCPTHGPGFCEALVTGKRSKG